MTITTEEAERLATMLVPLRDVAAGLRSLAAERDALRANLDAIVIPTTYYMDPPDGGDVSIAEQVRRMYRHVCDLQAENARLRESLRQIELDCDADYPPSYGAIKYAIRAALGETQ
jgi:hypothetical protein